MDNEKVPLQIITVLKKPPRNRGATWTDNEVHKLFHVWIQPDIYNGFLGEKRKREIFLQVSAELRKLGVSRTLEEIRAKIKNLKGDFKRAKEQSLPQSFKFYSLMENILRPTTVSVSPEESTSSRTNSRQVSISGCDLKHSISNNNITVLTTTDQQLVNQQQPVQIEFELMSNEDFQNMKGEQLPIEIEDGNIVLPQDFSPEDDVISDCEQESGIITRNQLDDGTPLIVIETNTDHLMTSNHQHRHLNLEEEQSSYRKTETETESYPQSSFTNKVKKTRKLNSLEITQKRRKLNSISEKMADTVSRILTQTTNSLIEEIKASEERFMKWEENRRQEEQKREAKMLRQLVNAIKSKSNREADPENSDDEDEKDKAARERQKIIEMMKTSDDPCAVTFDLLATKLTTMLKDQSKETEESLIAWEGRMQKQEMHHTENLFKILINAVNNGEK